MTFVFLTIDGFSRFPASKRALGMGEGLARIGHEVYIVAMDCEENRRRMKLEASHCKPVWIIKSNLIAELFSKLRAVRHIAPDVLYSPSYTLRNMAFMKLFIRRRTKTAVEFCELYSRYSSGLLPWRLIEYLAVLENDHIVCASKVLEEHFLGLCAKRELKRNIFYLPYAYPGYLKKHRRVTEVMDGKTVLFMAALWKGYGIYDVLNAIAIVKSQVPNVILKVIGRGPEEQGAKDYIKRQNLDGNVVMHGFVEEDDLDGLFSTADVFVSPLHDSFQDRARCPSKIYYYIPYEKPIVTCKLGDPYETLGDSGFYYEPDNINDMARAILRALDRADSFTYPQGLIEKHSWYARARQFELLLKQEK